MLLRGEAGRSRSGWPLGVAAAQKFRQHVSGEGKAWCRCRDGACTRMERLSVAADVAQCEDGLPSMIDQIGLSALLGLVGRGESFECVDDGKG